MNVLPVSARFPSSIFGSSNCGLPTKKNLGGSAVTTSSSLHQSELFERLLNRPLPLPLFCVYIQDTRIYSPILGPARAYKDDAHERREIQTIEWKRVQAIICMTFLYQKHEHYRDQAGPEF